MIFEVQDYGLIFEDMVYSLAIGFAAGLLNQLLSLFFHRGKISMFIKDVIMCTSFTRLVFSYAVSFANYPILRWYNIAGAAVGFFLFFPRFSPVLQKVLDRRICSALSRVRGKIFALLSSAGEIFVKNLAKHQKFTIKSNKELLQSDSILLYN